jgi:diguanylate cyclase (GGDEF)-like protein
MLPIDRLETEDVFLGEGRFLMDPLVRGQKLIDVVKGDFVTLTRQPRFFTFLKGLYEFQKKKNEVFGSREIRLHRFQELLSALWQFRYGRLLKFLESDFPQFLPEFDAFFDQQLTTLFVMDEDWFNSEGLKSGQAGIQNSLDHAFNLSSQLIYDDKWKEGILKLRPFQNARRQAIEAAFRSRQSVSQGFLDIDKFKAFNDHYGEDAGDEVIQQVLTVARKTLRMNDVIGRLGGEEFGILLPFTDAAQSRVAMEKVRKAVADHVFTFTSRTGELIQRTGITVSIGIETIDFTTESLPESLKNRQASPDEYEAYFAAQGQRLSSFSDLAMKGAKCLPRDEAGHIILEGRHDYPPITRNHVFHYQDVAEYVRIIDQLTSTEDQKRH